MISDDKLDTIRDLKKFAEKFLCIKAKGGGLVPFAFNRAQLYVHEKLEMQLKEMGMVRAVLLKGRQQGLSTYIQGRYFHKVITKRGRKAFILTHEADATQNLFEMTKRYYDNLPDGLCPKADTSSAKELYFDKPFDSGYSVGTAGNKGVGRSQTIQLFHGSEVAFWPHADEHAKGVLQAVSDEANTEILLESTANGIGNYFHSRWKEASGGSSEYQAIFVPWYWQNEYTSSTDGFQPNEEERLLLDAYEQTGLTSAHLAWRRKKISGFKGGSDAGLESFKQEYPFSATEAFLNPIDNVFISSRDVMRARTSIVDSNANLIIGVDVAISDRDKTAIVRRRGRCVSSVEVMSNMNTMEICGYLGRIIRNENPTKVYIDCIGIGAGVVDRLLELGFSCVVGVNVARSANEKDSYRNLRAELWASLKSWLTQEMPVQIPNDDELHGEICSLGYKFDSSGKLQIESKDELRSRGMSSPDRADALCLTFAGGFYGDEAQLEYRKPLLTGREKSMWI